MTYKFSKVINTLILIVCLVMLVACSPEGGSSLPILATRTITDGNLPFHETWRRDGLLLLNTKSDLLHVHDDYLFFVSYENGGAQRKLEVLNAKNGELLWKTDPLPFSVNSLTADAQRVYLALSSKIIVYDLVTGKVLWEDSLLGGRTTYWLYLVDDTLLVYSEEDTSSEGDEEQIIRNYDAQSGLLISMDRFDIRTKNSSLLLKTPNYDYWTDRNTLWTINTVSKQEQWKVEIDKKIVYEPLLIDNTFVFSNGIFSDVNGVDNTSGRKIWKYNNEIVSNLAVSQGMIYTIRADAAIVGIDSRTGEEMGYIVSEPRLTEMSSRSHAYLVATSASMLYVYYGDSQELIAFSR